MNNLDEAQRSDSPALKSEIHKNTSEHGWLADAASEAWKTTKNALITAEKVPSRIYEEAKRDPENFVKEVGGAAVIAGALVFSPKLGKAAFNFMEHDASKFAETLFGSSTNNFYRPAFANSISSVQSAVRSFRADNKIISNISEMKMSDSSLGESGKNQAVDDFREKLRQLRSEMKFETEETKKLPLERPPIDQEVPRPTFEKAVFTNPEFAKEFANKVEPIYQQFDKSHIPSPLDKLLGFHEETEEAFDARLNNALILENGVNDFLHARRLPEISLTFSEDKVAGSAHIDWGHMNISSADLDQPSKQLTAILGHELTHFEQFVVAVRRLADELNIGENITSAESAALKAKVKTTLGAPNAPYVDKFIDNAMADRSGVHLNSEETVRANALIDAIAGYRNGRGPWDEASLALRKLDKDPEAVSDLLQELKVRQDTDEPDHFAWRLETLFGKAEPTAELQGHISKAFDGFDQAAASNYLEQAMQAHLANFNDARKAAFDRYYASPIEVEARQGQQSVMEHSKFADYNKMIDVFGSQKFRRSIAEMLTERSKEIKLEMLTERSKEVKLEKPTEE